MLRQLERSTIHLLAKRGKSQRQIARELGYSRTTVALGPCAAHATSERGESCSDSRLFWLGSSHQIHPPSRSNAPVFPWAFFSVSSSIFYIKEHQRLVANVCPIPRLPAQVRPP